MYLDIGMMNYKRKHNFFSESSAIKRELEVIEEQKMEITNKIEGDVIDSFNNKVFCSLKKF